MPSRPFPLPVTKQHFETELERYFRAGRLAEAKTLCERLLAENRHSTPALFFLGLIHLSRGEKRQAESMLRRCVKVDNRHIGAHISLASLLLERGRGHEALACYRQVEGVEPDNFRLPHARGKCLEALGRYDEAEAAYRQALSLKPDYAEAARELGILLRRLGQFDEAEQLLLGLTISLPNLTEPWLNLGKIYRLQGRIQEARQYFNGACRAAPDNREAMLGLAWAMLHSNDVKNAEALILRAQQGIVPPAPEALALMAEVRARQGDIDSGIKLMTEAIAGGVRSTYEYLTLAHWHGVSQNRAQAVETLADAIHKLGHSSPILEIALFYNRLCICDWRDIDETLSRIKTYVLGHYPIEIQPFRALHIPKLTAADLQRTTTAYSNRYAPWSHNGFLLDRKLPQHNERLRIGYLSADFHEHATAYLTASVFEHHDRKHFEVFAYSYGPDDGSPTRRRLEAAFEHFVELRDSDHLSAARRIAADGIHILIDLKGYTHQARPEILALKPAPIQVNWLGFPGTMGADFMDYIIVDQTVVPPADASAYTEALAYLPHAYAPIDLARDVSPMPTRVEAGLPGTGFIFCCFNNPRKIIPEVFDRWCRILLATPKSVLWLYAQDEVVTVNLRKEATRRGLDPHRLIFATHVTQAKHLGRLPLADLVLDTLPCNAHTTTADALFMGVPVLTCLGSTFPGRVAASLLRAAGVPELVTQHLDEYESQALDLASDPLRLSELRCRIQQARHRQPYFDVVGFTHYLEDLYKRMGMRFGKGLPPAILDPVA